MKKQYINPETEVVRLHLQGGLLIASLNNGEVGAPEMSFDDLPSVPDLPGVPGIPGVSEITGISGI